MYQELIKTAKSDFVEALKCNPIYAKTQEKIIELIDLYWVDKYLDSEYNELGVKKAFYNIIENPTLVASKMIDIDTKDILVLAEDGQSYYPSWLLGKELRQWMKSKKNSDGKTFGQLLNQMTYALPKYGHLLVKKVGDSVSLVPLQNVMVKQGSKNFMDSPYLIEEHTYTPEQFLKIGKERKWNNVKEVYDFFKEKDEIEVYEISAHIDGQKENYFIIPEGVEDDFILYKAKIDREDLYKELKWDDIPGRALGRGQVEKLFEAQIHTNKVENYKTDGMQYTSKHVFQTRDDGIGRNMLTEVDNGEILTANSEITPVAMEERNLSAYAQDEARWGDLTVKRTFAYDTISGERSPAGTPLGATVLQAQMAGGFFDLKREDFGLFVRDIIADWILPEFKKQSHKLHNILLGEFDEGELRKLKATLVKHYTNKRIIDFIIKNKKIPVGDEFDALKTITESFIDNQKVLEIPADYYDDIKYKVQVVVTGESIDVGTKMQTLQVALQMIGGNPTILQDPNTRQYFSKLLELSGLSPTDFDTETPSQSPIAQIAGSVAKAPTPTMTTTKSPTNITI